MVLPVYRASVVSQWVMENKAVDFGSLTSRASAPMLSAKSRGMSHRTLPRLADSKPHIGITRVLSLLEIPARLDTLSPRSLGPINDMVIQAENMLYGRNGVRQTIPAAIEAIQRCSELGHPRAIAYLAHWLSTGFQSISVDQLKSKLLANLSSEKRDVFGQLLCVTGRDTMDTLKATHVFEVLQGNSDLDHPLIQYCLGICYNWGLGVLADRYNTMLWYERAAAQSHLPAMYNLAVLLESGHGSQEPDPKRAMKLYQAASVQGYAPAIHNCGVAFFEGKLVPRDLGKAVRFFKRGAKMNNPASLLALGTCLFHGMGVKRHFERAMNYFEKAALMDNSEAQTWLGICFQRGTGAIQSDHAQAASWFRASADRGNSEGMYNLAMCYQHGQGVEYDPVAARLWMIDAANAGNVQAKQFLTKLNHTVDVMGVTSLTKSFLDADSPVSQLLALSRTITQPPKPTSPLRRVIDSDGEERGYL